VAFIIAIPVIIISAIFQMVIFSRVNLLSGSADIMLVVLVAWSLQDKKFSAWAWAIMAGLLISYISALPMAVPLISYFATVGLAKILQRRVWQSPILTLFVLIFLATLFQHIISIGALQLSGIEVSISEGLSRVTLPSLFLNLLLGLPVYIIMRDLYLMVSPNKDEE
jgi:cell shape-determining protein MreD